tara:strand:- start:340 stop:474 length:135 start_codon:yes stop_codon:yes gene_type:complete
MPAALVEPLFITNKKELAILKQRSKRQDISDAIYKGVRTYFSTY